MAWIDEKLLAIYHTGYQKVVIKEKMQRNLNILKQEHALGRPIESLYRYFFDCYWGLAQKDIAVEYAKLDVEYGKRTTSDASRCYRGILSYYAQVQNRENAQERLS